MNSKEITKIKQNFFTKIKDFFKRIFSKKHKDIMLNASNTVSTPNLLTNDSQKEQFFDLYNNIKNGKVNVFNVDINKLQKVCQMLEEECKFKEMRLKNTKEDIENHRKNIMYYKNISKNMYINIKITKGNICPIVIFLLYFLKFFILLSKIL